MTTRQPQADLSLSGIARIYSSATDALTLVFGETKRGASDLAGFLSRQGYGCVAIHGDLKQFERERHLDSFRSAQAPVMIATAVRLSRL